MSRELRNKVREKSALKVAEVTQLLDELGLDFEVTGSVSYPVIEIVTKTREVILEVDLRFDIWFAYDIDATDEIEIEFADADRFTKLEKFLVMS